MEAGARRIYWADLALGAKQSTPFLNKPKFPLKNAAILLTQSRF
jgi:hypothetical protein